MSPGVDELVRDLTAGLAAPDDEHAAVGELRRSPVVPRVELEDVLGQVVAERGSSRSLVGACGDDHGVRGQSASPTVSTRKPSSSRETCVTSAPSRTGAEKLSAYSSK